MNRSAENSSVPFGAPVDGGPGFVPRVADVAVEGGVVFLRDFVFTPAPEGGAFRYGSKLAVFLKLDGERDVVGPFADDGFDAQGFEEFFRVRLHVEDDGGTGFVAGGGFEGVDALAGGDPGPGFLVAGFAGNDFDFVSHHEGGVEADAELADEAGAVFRLFFGEGGG